MLIPLPYRDDRDTHIRQHDEAGNPIRRWTDRGLGDNYATIARNCERLATTGLRNNVGARTLVISPQVDFMQALPPDRREPVMAELTGNIVDNWFEAMNLPSAEYAFVVHRGTIRNDRPAEVEQAPEEFVHSHVVLAATVPGLMQDRDDYKVYREQLEKLHRAGADEMERLWTRELGQERVQQLNQQLETLTQQLKEIDTEREKTAIEAAMPEPHERDEALLEIYQTGDIEPSPELLERVYEARSQIDPLEELRDLGFDIPQDDEVDVLQDLREIGFDIPQDDEVDVLQDLREIGFDIPQDDEVDVLQDLRDIGFDIPYDESLDFREDDSHQDVIDIARELDIEISPGRAGEDKDRNSDVYRESGFFDSDSRQSPAEQMQDVISELRELGFDIPDDDIPDSPNREQESDLPDLPDIDL